MKYLVAILSLVAGLATAADFGTSHDIILFGEQSIAAGETNTVETTYKVRGMLYQGALFQSGSGISTTVVYGVRGSVESALISGIVQNGSGQQRVSVSYPGIGLYDQTIKFVTINSGTNTITVTPAIIYEK